MKPFEKCPICGGELVEKEVEKLLKGGSNVGVIKIKAEVCLRCGERIYPQETVREFEIIREKLEQNEIADFQPMGKCFKVQK
jgi:YgiT-type zinc finger domain-containing protein